jgi:hypothetical protein
LHDDGRPFQIRSTTDFFIFHLLTPTFTLGVFFLCRFDPGKALEGQEFPFLPPDANLSKDCIAKFCFCEPVRGGLPELNVALEGRGENEGLSEMIEYSVILTAGDRVKVRKQGIGNLYVERTGPFVLHHGGQGAGLCCEAVPK